MTLGDANPVPQISLLRDPTLSLAPTSSLPMPDTVPASTPATAPATGNAVARKAAMAAASSKKVIYAALIGNSLIAVDGE